MIDRVRIALNRPIGDAQRRRLFVLATATVVLAAVAFSLIDRPAARPLPSPSRRAALAAPPPAPSTPEPSAVSPLERPSEAGRPPAHTLASGREIALARRAARRFLAAYLPYTYGRGLGRIGPASVQLRRRLAAQRPRVPGRERRRRPRVVLIQADGAGRVRMGLVALVDDGARRYTVALELMRRRSGRTVIDA